MTLTVPFEVPDSTVPNTTVPVLAARIRFWYKPMPGEPTTTHELPSTFTSGTCVEIEAPLDSEKVSRTLTPAWLEATVTSSLIVALGPSVELAVTSAVPEPTAVRSAVARPLPWTLATDESEL